MNVYLHPTLIRRPGAVATLERKTNTTAVVVRKGKVVQLLDGAAEYLPNQPKPAA